MELKLLLTCKRLPPLTLALIWLPTAVTASVCRVPAVKLRLAVASMVSTPAWILTIFKYVVQRRISYWLLAPVERRPKPAVAGLAWTATTSRLPPVKFACPDWLRARASAMLPD